MAIKTTKWRLDTCSCELEYTWDDSVADTSRVHNFSRYITRCGSHNALSDSTLYDTCLEENQRKNIALQVSLDNGPTTLYDVVSGVRVLKPTIMYNKTWSGTAPNRVLSISFTGVSLTNAQKTTIRNALNSRFGTGEVNIV